MVSLSACAVFIPPITHTMGASCVSCHWPTGWPNKMSAVWNDQPFSILITIWDRVMSVSQLVIQGWKLAISCLCTIGALISVYLWLLPASHLVYNVWLPTIIWLHPHITYNNVIHAVLPQYPVVSCLYAAKECICMFCNALLNESPVHLRPL